MQFTRGLSGPCQSRHCGESYVTMSLFQSYKSLKHHQQPLLHCTSSMPYIVLNEELHLPISLSDVAHLLLPFIS